MSVKITNIKFNFRAYIFVFLIVSFLQSCMSSTVINSEPQDADVYINQIYAGKTPVVLADRKLSMTPTYIRIEKEGYLPIDTYIVKDEKINVGAAVAGVFFYYPWLWVFEYEPYHNYILLTDDNQQDDIDYYYQNDNPPSNATNDVDNTNQNQQKSKAQKLRELKALLDDGIITQDEYNTEKQKILDQDNW